MIPGWLRRNISTVEACLLYCKLEFRYVSFLFIVGGEYHDAKKGHRREPPWVEWAYRLLKIFSCSLRTSSRMLMVVRGFMMTERKTTAL